MNRDPDSLADGFHDVTVLGGGAAGAWIALEATRRGLSVALLERSDFGSGASSNSLKVLHAGFRYLSKPDPASFQRSRQAVAAWKDLSPGLVDPLPVHVPVSGSGLERSVLLGAAVMVERGLDLVGGGREATGLPAARLRGPRSGWKPALLDDTPAETALEFWDGLMYSSERLVMTALLEAAESGALILNYLEPIGLEARDDGYVLRCQDLCAETTLEVRTRHIVNATGAAATSTLEELAPGAALPRLTRVRGVNLIFPDMGLEAGLAVRPPPGSEGDTGGGADRRLFLVPWRGRTLAGTAYGPPSGPSDGNQSRERLTRALLNNLAAALPVFTLTIDDVLGWHEADMPAPEGRRGLPLDTSVVKDHRTDGWQGLLTAVTDKYTTAPLLAANIVDRLSPPDGRGDRSAPSANGRADEGHPEEITAEDRMAFGALPAAVKKHLSRVYGDSAPELARYRHGDPGWDQLLVVDSPAIRAQIHRAADVEMAQTLEDVLHRRLELGPRCLSSAELADRVRDVMDTYGSSASSTSRRLGDGR